MRLMEATLFRGPLVRDSCVLIPDRDVTSRCALHRGVIEGGEVGRGADVLSSALAGSGATDVLS